MIEHVQPVMEALVSHMAEEENGMKALAKGQKKIGKQFEAHAASDLEQFTAVRELLANQNLGG